MHKKELLPLGLIAASLIAAAYLYPGLPEQMPVHWNAAGEVDGWSGKLFGAFFFPLLTLAMYLLLTFIPRIDPLRKNYADFAGTYFWIRTTFVVFFLSLYTFTLFAAFDRGVQIVYFMFPAISILFILIGVFLRSVKKNYFVGIRTPWTLHSERVWNETHVFSSKVFIAAGLLSFLALFVPENGFMIVLVAALGAAICSVAYSYISFRRNKEEQ